MGGLQKKLIILESQIAEILQKGVKFFSGYSNKISASLRLNKKVITKSLTGGGHKFIPLLNRVNNII